MNGNILLTGGKQMKEQIQKLVDLGVAVNSICRQTGIPRSTFDYWFRCGQALNESNEKKVREWLDNFIKEVESFSKDSY